MNDLWGLALLLAAPLLFLAVLRLGVAQVGTETLQDELKAGKKLHIVDVREPHEFRQGRIPGARNVPLAKLPGALHGKINNDDDIVLVCATGVRSAMALRRLRQAGYKRLRNLTGGMRAWNMLTRR